jgi:DNA-binding NarL/FixJ family response regulator
LGDADASEARAKTVGKQPGFMEQDEEQSRKARLLVQEVPAGDPSKPALKPSDLPHRSHGGQGSMAPAEGALPSAPPVALFIDKQSLTRECIGALLATHLSEWAFQFAKDIRDIPKIGGSPRAFLAILHTHAASVSSPEVVSEIRAITEAAPGAALIVLSDKGEAGEVHMAMQLGARGYLPVDLPIAQAAGAIRFVGDGGTYIPVCVLAAASAHQRTSQTHPMDSEGNPIHFSRRQLEVLERLKQGKQNKIIAHELNMCVSTVKVHIRHIMRKLKARNRTQVILLTGNKNRRHAVGLAPSS